ncbi:2423_t:CDS:2 [Diversispora eburnea]|uniref:2423_t:CDS:1 n=1 Tax=Diversispora eburnea TaxID=1213867 RepID=A0A9N9G2G2_9GLOM|nr:2423_t:CDS:2 [Diversispora eburnea]
MERKIRTTLSRPKGMSKKNGNARMFSKVSWDVQPNGNVNPEGGSRALGNSDCEFPPIQEPHEQNPEVWSKARKPKEKRYTECSAVGNAVKDMNGTAPILGYHSESM